MQKKTILSDSFIKQIQAKIANEPFCRLEILIREGKPQHAKITVDIKPEE